MVAGLVNVNVVYAALHQSKQHAKWMALGGVLPELLYSAIAIFGVELVRTNQKLFDVLQSAVIAILIGMGVFFLFQKQDPDAIQEDKSQKRSFLKGLLLAMVNPQLITFWFGWLLIAYTFLDFDDYSLISPKLTFVLGTAVGAYIMLRILIYITVRNRDRILGWMRFPINKVIGWILVAIGLLQLGITLIHQFS